jgi:hypothetical protein
LPPEKKRCGVSAYKEKQHEQETSGQQECSAGKGLSGRASAGKPTGKPGQRPSTEGKNKAALHGASAAAFCAEADPSGGHGRNDPSEKYPDGHEHEIVSQRVFTPLTEIFTGQGVGRP